MSRYVVLRSPCLDMPCWIRDRTSGIATLGFSRMQISDIGVCAGIGSTAVCGVVHPANKAAAVILETRLAIVVSMFMFSILTNARDLPYSKCALAHGKAYSVGDRSGKPGVFPFFTDALAPAPSTRIA